MVGVSTLISKMRDTASQWFADDSAYDVVPSSKKKDDVVDFVNSCFNDSRTWRETSLRGRFINGSFSYDDPLRLWKDCRKLRNGNHWDVWGHRNTDKSQAWMHEIVWSSIEDQSRIRKIYLTSNMHEFDVMPNINNIGDFVRQDMMKSKWYGFVNELVDRGITDGTAFGMEILDRDLDPDGISRSITLDPASVFPTPGATSFQKIDGCWYAIIATTQTRHAVVNNPAWKDTLDVDALTYISSEDFERVSVEEKYDKFRNRNLVLVKTMFLDDEAMEPIPFNQEEFNTRIQALIEGVDVPVLDGTDNHRRYIREYIDYLDRYSNSITDPTEKDIQFFQQLSARIVEIVDRHEQFLQQNNNSDKRNKYPYGRKIVVVSDQVVEDGPVSKGVANELDGIDWRRLIYKYDMERVPGSFWGRGIPEAMWQTNKMMDTFLSRIGDMTLYGLPEKWLNVADKEALAQAGVQYTNNPLEVKYYATAAPQMISASMPGEFILLVQKMQEALDMKYGYNKAAQGQAPNSRASGELVDTLLQQSSMLLTGEADQNLLDLVGDIVETKIDMMRLYYTEARQYIIDGQPVVLKLAELMQSVNGHPLGGFQVFVKPQSNYPNQWEGELKFLMGLSQTVDESGTPYVPSEAVKQHLGKKFPDLAPGGKYYQMSKALQIGMQVLEQQKMEAEKQAGLEKKIETRAQGKQIERIMPPTPPQTEG